jgi:fatty acid desaturase
MIERLLATSQIQSLRRELTAAGLFEHHTHQTAVKFVALVGSAGLLTALLVLSPWWAAFALVPAIGLLVVAAAMIGHEGGHGSFARNRRLNAILIHAAFPLLTGLGVIHWKRKHNVLHHGHPNVAGIDDDIDLWPMALSPRAHAASGPARRWFQLRLQGYLFWPLTLLLSWVMRLASVRALFSHARTSGSDARLVADAGCQLLHYLVWLLLPSFFFGFWPVFLFYLSVWAVAGSMLAAIFAPAHIGLPITDEPAKGWLHQFETTRNLRVPGALGFFFMGLQHQVEHHLFPRMPHQNLPRASMLVRAFCARLGVPYQEIGYFSGLVDTTRFVARGWRQPAGAPS